MTHYERAVAEALARIQIAHDALYLMIPYTTVEGSELLAVLSTLRRWEKKLEGDIKVWDEPTADESPEHEKLARYADCKTRGDAEAAEMWHDAMTPETQELAALSDKVRAALTESHP
jgi:hypothetical protein